MNWDHVTMIWEMEYEGWTLDIRLHQDRYSKQDGIHVRWLIDSFATRVDPWRYYYLRRIITEDREEVDALVEQLKETIVLDFMLAVI